MIILCKVQLIFKITLLNAFPYNNPKESNKWK